MGIAFLKSRWGTLTLLGSSLFVIRAEAGPALTAVPAEVVRAAQNFSRLEQLINSQRSIAPSQPSGAPGKVDTRQFLGELPVPQEIMQQAQAIVDSSESWACEMEIKERSKVTIKFGDQTVDVVPFDFYYRGKSCVVDIKASMDAGNVAGDSQSFLVTTHVDFKLLDNKHKSVFGMEEAHIDQATKVKVLNDAGKMKLGVSIETAGDSLGGIDGPVHVNQDLSLKFEFTPPLNLAAESEDSHKFSVNGKGAVIRRKQSLAGFSQKIEHWIDDKLVNKKTFEETLQGLHFFGINDKPAVSSTLACTVHFYDSAHLSVQDRQTFQAKGQIPAQPASMIFSSCGKSKTTVAGPYTLASEFTDKWQTTTIRRSQDPRALPLEVYFLYDEDSFFIRDLDQYTLLMACRSEVKCKRGDK